MSAESDIDIEIALDNGLAQAYVHALEAEDVQAYELAELVNETGAAKGTPQLSVSCVNSAGLLEQVRFLARESGMTSLELWQHFRDMLPERNLPEAKDILRNPLIESGIGHAMRMLRTNEDPDSACTEDLVDMLSDALVSLRHLADHVEARLVREGLKVAMNGVFHGASDNSYNHYLQERSLRFEVHDGKKYWCSPDGFTNVDENGEYV